MSKILISKTQHTVVLFSVVLPRTVAGLVVTLFEPLASAFLYCALLFSDQITAASITVQHHLLDTDNVHA